MNSRLLLICVWGIGVAWTVPSTVIAQVTEGADTVFQSEHASEIILRFTAEEWSRLQPSSELDWDVGRAFGEVISDASQGKEFRAGEENRPGLGGYLGLNHQYGKADFVIDGEQIPDVGVRFKGNGSFLSGRAFDKYSFKVDFNEYQDDLSFGGLKKLNLQSCAADPTMLREAVSYELFREAGVPASLTGWASVTTEIDGEVKKRGLFLVVEQVDKQFLKRAFGESDGLLVKPSAFTAFPYLGETWGPYESYYNPKTKPTDEQQRRLIEFAKLIHLSDKEEFDSRVEEFLNLESFLSFLSVNVILSNLDSFLGGSQNYYAYLSAETNKFQLIPWDLDHSFGSLEIIGTPESRVQHSIKQPQLGSGQNRLIERLLDMPEVRKEYLASVERLSDSVFAKQKWIDQVEARAAFVRPLLDDKERQRMDAAVRGEAVPGKGYSLEEFVRTRHDSVQDQLVGKSEGQTNDFNQGLDRKLVIQTAAWGLAIVFAAFLNLIVCIWASVSGFRSSPKWGLLNLFLYPLSPLVFGFLISRKHGLRSAVLTLLCVSLMIGFVFPFIQAVSSF